ncbi:MAG: hypothetical protein ACJAYJ_004251 [Saprospiraceae bacterium]|jgi:hypothetical protein
MTKDVYFLTRNYPYIMTVSKVGTKWCVAEEIPKIFST